MSKKIDFSRPKRLDYATALELLPKYLHLKEKSFINTKTNKKETIKDVIITPANDANFYNCILEGIYMKSFEKSILEYKDNKVQITCLLEGLSQKGAIRSIYINDALKYINIYKKTHIVKH